MKTAYEMARLLAYVTGLVNQELLLQIEYLAAENRILIVMGGGVAVGGGQLRHDLGVKVFKLLSESEIGGSHGGVSQLRVSDSEHFRRWEVAGAATLGSHDLQQVAPLMARDFGRSPSPQCDLPPFSRIPSHLVMNAALDHLVRWMKENVPPPTAREIQLVTLGRRWLLRGIRLGC